MSPRCRQHTPPRAKTALGSDRRGGALVLYLSRAADRACGRVRGGNGDDLPASSQGRLEHVGAQQAAEPGGHSNRAGDRASDGQSREGKCDFLLSLSLWGEGRDLQG